MNTIYLDNNATTRVAPEVFDAMLPFLKDSYGNPSSIHRFGGLIRRNIDKAREQVAALINARPEEIIFTSCGSESDNHALQGFYRNDKQGMRIITSPVEHPAVRTTAQRMKHWGVSLIELEVDSEGMFSPDRLDGVEVDGGAEHAPAVVIGVVASQLGPSGRGIESRLGARYILRDRFGQAEVSLRFASGLRAVQLLEAFPRRLVLEAALPIMAFRHLSSPVRPY